MKVPLDGPALDQLFLAARTHNSWAPRGVSEGLMRRLYGLARWGPTSANVSPARFVFVSSDEAKARLAPHLSSANREKTLAAPVCVIIAYDLQFAERIPELFPHNPGAKHWFSEPAVAEETAFRNGSLQGAYLILAARALGLDCGPMSGFNRQGIDDEFFAGMTLRTNFLCNVGYGTDEGLFARSPRLEFDDACRIL